MRMKKTTRLAVGAMLATTTLALSACVLSFPGGGTMMGDGDTTSPADVMFVQMMIPHHEQAVEMSDLILAKEGVDAPVALLAEQIRDGQEPEIRLMEQWQDQWGLPSMPDMGGMGHGGMDGMVSDAQMARLEAAEGATGSTLFLELMIEHHEGAITMAQDVVDDGRHDGVRELARQMIDVQREEIATMEELLAR